jgi:hypothetical protein
MRLAVVLVIVSLFAAACGGARSVREPPSAPPPAAQPVVAVPPAPATPGDTSCGLRASDARVGAQDVDRGAALVFTTSDDVAWLRRRVSDLEVPDSLERAESRSDNIHGGVRLVFEAGALGDVATVRREVRAHAKQMAKTCGLVLAAPRDRTAERAERAETPAARPKADAKPGRTSPAPTKADKPKPKKAPPKSDAKPKPKPADTPKAKEKPKPDLQPKPDKKPLPRLPGPEPVPLPSARSISAQGGGRVQMSTKISLENAPSLL